MSLYADFYYAYNSSQQVVLESIQGGSRTYAFTFTLSNNTPDYNHWATKTVETLPDGNQNIVYSNYAGQTMLKVFQSGTDQWLTYSRYNSTGQLILQANPSAMNGFDDTITDLVN